MTLQQCYLISKYVLGKLLQEEFQNKIVTVNTYIVFYCLYTYCVCIVSTCLLHISIVALIVI